MIATGLALLATAFFSAGTFEFFRVPPPLWLKASVAGVFLAGWAFIVAGAVVWAWGALP